MAAILTDLGEEWLIETDVTGVASLDFGLYNDSTDAITDSEDLADITTEPSDGNYTRQTANISVSDISGNWGFDNDSNISFDVTSTTGTVDSYFIVANFQANDTGDGSPTDHLIMTGALSQSYDLSNLDTLDITAGTAGLTVN